jgi:hypothetical protein
MASDDDYATLDQAWDALDAGDPERALELTRGAPEELGETWVLRATAALDLDDLDGARAAAQTAAELAPEEDDAELLCVQAEIALREWRSIRRARSSNVCKAARRVRTCSPGWR